jgi:hypothetical protein
VAQRPVDLRSSVVVKAPDSVLKYVPVFRLLLGSIIIVLRL